jgi:hypothetical protein
MYRKCRKTAGALISLALTLGMGFTRTLDVTELPVFADHRNLQPASCSFLPALECDQICSRPRRIAMVTAWVRSLA